MIEDLNKQLEELRIKADELLSKRQEYIELIQKLDVTLTQIEKQMIHLSGKIEGVEEWKQLNS